MVPAMASPEHKLPTTSLIHGRLTPSAKFVVTKLRFDGTPLVSTVSVNDSTVAWPHDWELALYVWYPAMQVASVQSAVAGPVQAWHTATERASLIPLQATHVSTPPSAIFTYRVAQAETWVSDAEVHEIVALLAA